MDKKSKYTGASYDLQNGGRTLSMLAKTTAINEILP